LDLGFILCEAFNKAIPPPGTIPSFIAAFVAQIASSTLSFFSFNSTSELAPTFTIATLAESIANLFSSLIMIFGFFSFAISFLIFSISSSASFGIFLTCSIVSPAEVIDLTHSPNCSSVIKSMSSPRSSFIKVAPVSKHKSFKTVFLLIP